MSNETIKNSRKRVSKAYYNTKANIGDIVFDLLAEDNQGIQTSKEVFIEETVGTRAMVLTNSNPFSVIKKLSRVNVSKEVLHIMYFLKTKTEYISKLYKNYMNNQSVVNIIVVTKGVMKNTPHNKTLEKLHKVLKECWTIPLTQNKMY